jgi:uncharacterized small protein (TIGR04563 family)
MADKPKNDARKQSLYFPETMLQEISEEAGRLERSLSWVVQRAWKLSRAELKKLPGVNDPSRASAQAAQAAGAAAGGGAGGGGGASSSGTGGATGQ